MYTCHCQAQVDLLRHYLLSGIPATYWTLSDHEFFGDPKALAEKNKYLERWENFKRYGLGVEFYSPTLGTGKTMLATLIGKELIKRGEHVRFVYFRDILGLYQKPYEERAPIEHKLRTAQVLILDEVSDAISEAQRAYFAEEFEALVRFRTTGNSVTIMTTNLTPEQIEDKYPRVYSLLSAKQMRVKVNGTDGRAEVDWMLKTLALNGEARPLV